VVDLHCHILPGVDDGPRTVEEAVAMCRAAEHEGTRTLVATPHVNGDYPGVTAGVIHSGAAAVNRALRAAAVGVDVRTGAEVALSRVGELSDTDLDGLTLGGGRSVLLELPWTSAATGAMGALRAFARRGYRIVLAHPERSPMLQRDEALAAELVQAGVLCCLDVASLGDRADRRTRTIARRLLAGRLVHAIASDCHDPVRRPPHLVSVLERAGLTGRQIDYFTRQAPEAILAGDAVPPPPAVDEGPRRRWLHRRR
jgi:protein-tyrosine phosphatase